MNPIRMREEKDMDAASLSEVFREVTGLDTPLVSKRSNFRWP